MCLPSFKAATRDDASAHHLDLRFCLPRVPRPLDSTVLAGLRQAHTLTRLTLSLTSTPLAKGEPWAEAAVDKVTNNYAECAVCCEALGLILAD